MKWDKKGIDKSVEKRNSALEGRSIGMVRRLKPMHEYLGGHQTRWQSQVALLDAERRKAKGLILIRRVSFM